MKKVLLGLALSTLMACDQNKQQAATAAAPVATLGIITKGNTLDGLPLAQAHTWVSNFKDDPGNQLKYTSVWFSRYWVKQTRLLLDREAANKVDGVRIYFAKNDAKQNTVIVMATKDGGADPNNPGAEIHRDFFDHPTAAYIRATANNADITEEYAPNEGTLLYQQNFSCPTVSCTTSASGHYITCGEAQKYVSSFTTTAIKTKAEWYGTSLIDALDDELTNARAQGNGADGVRLYFAIDDKNENTLVFVTTKKFVNSNGISFHQDYFDCHVNSPLSIMSMLNIKSKATRGGGDTSAYDRGEKCPIYCTGIDLPCDTCSTEDDKRRNAKVSIKK